MLNYSLGGENNQQLKKLAKGMRNYILGGERRSPKYPMVSFKKIIAKF
jgi:hypothetical protein